jgi:PhnB protein
MFLYVEDVVFERAIAAGAQELIPSRTAKTAARRGGLTDPFWHVWYASARTSRTSRARNSRNGTTL